MIVRRQGGMTEFIPSPREKREGLIRDHALELLANLDARLRRIEEALGLPQEGARAFAGVMARIGREEQETRLINRKLMDAGIAHGEEV